MFEGYNLDTSVCSYVIKVDMHIFTNHHSQVFPIVITVMNWRNNCSIYNQVLKYLIYKTFLMSINEIGYIEVFHTSSLFLMES